MGGGNRYTWDALGYTEAPDNYLDRYNYTLNIRENWDITRTNYKDAWRYDTSMCYFPEVDFSNVQDFSGTFANSGLVYLENIDFGNVTNMGETFLRMLSNS